MTTLLLDGGFDGASGSGEKGGREVGVLAETRTLATLETLDAAHKRQVMMFVVDASLVQGAPGEQPVLRLIGANLGGIVMPNTRLVGADLRDENLKGTALNGANLSDATGKTAGQLDGQAASLVGRRGGSAQRRARVPAPRRHRSKGSGGGSSPSGDRVGKSRYHDPSDRPSRGDRRAWIS